MQSKQIPLLWKVGGLDGLGLVGFVAGSGFRACRVYRGSGFKRAYIGM